MDKRNQGQPPAPELAPRGRPRGRPRNFDRTAALVAALELFWERGYEGTSLSELTARMGISATSLYAAFGSKENLFREAVAYYNDPQRSPTTRALRDQPTARAAVESMLRDNARLYTDPDSPRGCLIVLAGTTYTPDSEPVKDLLKDLRSRDLGDLLQRLHEASVDGELPQHVEPAALARFVITILQGLSIQARDGASFEQLDAVIDQTMRAWDHLTTA